MNSTAANHPETVQQPSSPETEPTCCRVARRHNGHHCPICGQQLRDMTAEEYYARQQAIERREWTRSMLQAERAM